MGTPAAKKPSRPLIPKVPQNGSIASSECRSAFNPSASPMAAAWPASVRCECATSFGPLVVPDVV